MPPIEVIEFPGSADAQHLPLGGEQAHRPDIGAVAPDRFGGADVSAMFEGYGDMLDVSDLAEILRINPKTVQRQCRRGDLPAIRIGARWYVPKIRLIEHVMGGAVS